MRMRDAGSAERPTYGGSETAAAKIPVRRWRVCFTTLHDGKRKVRPPPIVLKNSPLEAVAAS
jgi:hypothetical protein